MNNIKIVLSESDNQQNCNIKHSALAEKIVALQEIIKKTVIATQHYKKMDIYGANELSGCINSLEELFTILAGLLPPLHRSQTIDKNQYLTKLQEITTELSNIFRTFGTQSVDDLITVCFGVDFVNKYFCEGHISAKYAMIQRYVHPISYKIMNWKKDHSTKGRSSQSRTIKKNRIVEDFMIVETADNLDCFNLARTTKAFHTKVYGIKFCIQDPERERTVIIAGLVDDLMIDCLNYNFVEGRLRSIISQKPTEPMFKDEAFNRFICSLTIKELLVYNNEELYNRYVGYMNQCALIKQRTIAQVTKDFINSDLYSQRTTLIQLLLRSGEHEFQYISYLLYDLLSCDTNGTVDTQEQTLIFDSLPWNVKRYFRDAMKQTINYTNNLLNLDNAKIPLEQQICLLKADEGVKEKAMLKLKEIKAKSEDSGSKARQYLEGLLRIPFGIFAEEPILSSMQKSTNLLKKIQSKLETTPYPLTTAQLDKKLSIMEMREFIKNVEANYSKHVSKSLKETISNHLTKVKRRQLVENITYLNTVARDHKLNISKICHSGKKSVYMREAIRVFMTSSEVTYPILYEIALKFGILNHDQDVVSVLSSGISNIRDDVTQIHDYMGSVTNTLNDAVHGHDRAKRQVERIIGQWVNGEKTGYCFGFEGPPGVGKTSLAKKGIAKCLVDSDGTARPFSFIAIGGSSNGSTLEGHNYTYVGSTWGRIVDILMEKRCMNPIIFIDELDKVSRTEHGREIIGVLTHLVDPAQNDTFQDKYFNGIDIDLSRALFIFSYNDPESIDRILLDRIHRVKFEHLSLKDKLVVSKTHLLPEIYTKMGVSDTIEINDELIEHIIEQYTCEPGVRKLKEVLFEIVGELNLQQLKEETSQVTKIKVTKDDLKTLLKGRQPIRIKEVHASPTIGLITGLWANAMGRGGTLPIEARFFPAATFLDLKLTGSQGDVMKESMNVAKTLAWDLLPDADAITLQNSMIATKKQGIHIHVPEGATPKDGPSAGAAITVAMYSLLMQKPILNNIAMTGEICLQGKVTAIGGLDLKILGGIRANVTHFLYPADNSDEFNEFYSKYKDSDIIKNITFTKVATIKEVLDIVFA